MFQSRSELTGQLKEGLQQFTVLLGRCYAEPQTYYP